MVEAVLEPGVDGHPLHGPRLLLARFRPAQAIATTKYKTRKSRQCSLLAHAQVEQNYEKEVQNTVHVISPAEPLPKSSPHTSTSWKLA